ncbi:MAG: PKD domain-containing protein [Bacteroidales bacterium]|nr:PKD domain-containing protein [Bacteroidales bacterium]
MKKRVLLSVLLSLSMIVSMAQFPFIWISGHVTEITTGLPVSNHLVTAEIMAGGIVQTFDFLTNGNGYYSGDSIPSYGQGSIHVFTFDCNGQIHEEIEFISPAVSNYVFDFSICADSTGTGCEAGYYYEYLPGVSDGVMFFNTSTGSYTGLLWDFGDGTTSSEPDPIHIYNAFGTYNVCLSIWDNQGPCQDMYCELVEVGNNPGGCENFFYYETLNQIEFTFHGESLPLPAQEYIWEFGDGITGTGQMVTHTYDEALFNSMVMVTLITHSYTPAGDSCTATSTQEVWIGMPGTGCENWFMIQPMGPYTFEFFGESLPVPANYWHWDFGDGTTGSGQMVEHTYGPNSGEVVWVTLTTYIQDPATGDSCVAFSSQELWPGNPGGDCENWFFYETNDNITFTFTGESLPVPANAWIWEFGDGTTGFGQTATHTFDANVPLSLVCLTTISTIPGTIDSCFAVSCQEIQVGTGGGNYEIWGNVYMDSAFADYGIALLFGIENNGSVFVDAMAFEGGSYLFDGVPEGEYYVLAGLTPQSAFFFDYFPTYYGDALFWFNASVITLGEPANPYDIHLIPTGWFAAGPGQIEGLVNGEGIKGDMADITVVLMNEAGQPVFYTQTDDEGHFSFEGLGYATYRLMVEIPGKTSETAVVNLGENNQQGWVDFVVHETSVTLSVGDNRLLSFDISGIWPNPVTEESRISVTVETPSAFTVLVHNQTGETVLTESMYLETGRHDIRLNLGQLRAGFYTLSFINENGERLVRKFVTSR